MSSSTRDDLGKVSNFVKNSAISAIFAAKKAREQYIRGVQNNVEATLSAVLSSQRYNSPRWLVASIQYAPI